jgi:ABC-type transport system substrate-binding protein
MERKRRAKTAVWPIVLLASVGALVGAVRADAEPPTNVLQVDLATDIDFVDPALAYYTPAWSIEFATCAKLVNHPDRPAPAGSRLVPEIAQAMPTVSPDGRTYTFHVRDDFFFSPPSNERVTAAHFKFTLERILRPQMASPAQPFFEDIVGAKDIIDGKTTSLTGVTADGDTLRITLEAPAGDFLARLAMPFTCPLPLSTPVTPGGLVAPVPSAGPYYIAVREPTLRIVLRKNPNYGGSRPRRFDEIQYTIGFPQATIRLRVESGESDFAGDGVPPAAHAELADLYGPGSPAAAAGKQRWFAYPSATFRYFAMNHDRPLFGGGAKGNVPLKQAVNYAIDRVAMINQRGAHAGAVTDQYIPPYVPGFTDAALYPDRPDLAKALALANGNTRSGKAVMYCANTSPSVETCQIAQANLAAIGLDVEIQYFPRAVQFTKTGTRGEPFDITLEGWHMDYLDPYDFLFLLDGTRLRPANNVNFSYFNDPEYNAKLRAANLLTGEARYAALGNLDVEVARDSAPLAAFINDNTRQFYSDRVGCQVYHPLYELDLVALCLRPEITATDDSVVENAAAATFTISLSNAESQPLTVAYSTANGTATAGQDYVATSGTLTFAPGDRVETVTVDLINDAQGEEDETFFLELSNASKGTVLRRGAATLIDNDVPGASVGDATPTAEGNAGTTETTFEVSLGKAAEQTVTVNYATADGSATAPSDYIAKSGTLTFPPGERTARVTVLVNGDTTDEPDEAFALELANPVNGTIGDGRANAPIIDDDAAPAVSVVDVAPTVPETSGFAVFQVRLTAASAKTVVVGYATADGSAAQGADYTGTSGTLTFLPGETEKQVAVGILDDGLDEADETFRLGLSGPVNATITAGAGEATILDNEALPTLAVSDATAREGDSGRTEVRFALSLSPVSGRTVEVAYATEGGTAESSSDFVPASGLVRFDAGQTAKEVAVEVIGDVTRESDETFGVILSGASNTSLARARGTGTIVNDDAASQVQPLEASAALASSAVKVSAGGVAPIPIRCAGAPCRGTVVLFAPTAGQKLATSKLRLGSARFSIPAGRTATVRVKLSSRGLKLLRKAKRLRVQAVVTVGKKVSRRTIALRAPRGR